ncbi:MAG: methyltransferase domain-containing protein [Candidatus Doudnabacteria bacterium]|nr:methyltransferase domain-containing protein [Candidatus Doudnabacteria bacterium]
MNVSGSFLDPEKILFQAGLSKTQTVVDLGTGSGFYALAASKIVGEQGRVFVVDILESALSHISSEARVKGLRNIQTLRCDLELPRACASINEGVADFVIFANVLHEVTNKNNMFSEAFRLLKTGGKLLIIEWNDTPSPIGPESEVRVPQQEASDYAQKTKLRLLRRIDTDQYHYGLLFVK